MPIKPSFAEVWARLLRHAERPFMTDGGHEFTYHVEGEALRLSLRDALLARAALERAWAAMPCAAVDLPAVCKPRAYVWALLHDTRIAGTTHVPEIPAALIAAAKTEEKRPKPSVRKRRSHRAARRARARAAARRAAGR
ncbi:MAG: hypothetical protein ACREIA_10055 [Opitutaceae bacterium]